MSNDRLEYSEGPSQAALPFVSILLLLLLLLVVTHRNL